MGQSQAQVSDTSYEMFCSHLVEAWADESGKHGKRLLDKREGCSTVQSECGGCLMFDSKNNKFEIDDCSSDHIASFWFLDETGSNYCTGAEYSWAFSWLPKCLPSSCVQNLARYWK